ncbi:MAG: DUF1648 domain-containing protein [bacterium]
MKNPKIKIKLTEFDWGVEIVGIIALVTMIVLPAVQYHSLPDLIPRHFDLSGQPDAFGSNAFIWILPVVGIFVFLLLSLLNLFPHVFNYLVPITPDNAAKQYLVATRMMRILKTLVLVMFCFIIYEMMNFAPGKSTGLGEFFLPAVLVALLGVVGFFLIKSKRIG